MADPRDYVVQGFQGIGSGLAQYDQNRRQEEALNKPLPDWTVQQMVGPRPSAAPVGEAAGIAAGAGAGNFGMGAGMAGGLTAQHAALGQQPTQSQLGGGVGQEAPEIEAAAKAYASGNMSFEQALAQARKYTMRDMPGLNFGLQVREANRQQQRDENSLRREELITERVLAAQGLKNEGGAATNKSREEVARIHAKGKTDSAALYAQARIHAANQALRGALEKARQSGIAAQNKHDPRLVRLKGLQLQLEAETQQMGDFTQAYVGSLDEDAMKKYDQQVVQAAERVKGIAAQIQQLNEELGAPATSDGKAPFEVRQQPWEPPPPGMEGAIEVPPPANPIRTDKPVRGPNMGAVPPGPVPTTGSGRPVQPADFPGAVKRVGAQPDPLADPNTTKITVRYNKRENKTYYFMGGKPIKVVPGRVQPGA